LTVKTAVKVKIIARRNVVKGFMGVSRDRGVLSTRPCNDD
jgi:hypothetical protein